MYVFQWGKVGDWDSVLTPPGFIKKLHLKAPTLPAIQASSGPACSSLWVRWTGHNFKTLHNLFKSMIVCWNIDFSCSSNSMKNHHVFWFRASIWELLVSVVVSWWLLNVTNAWELFWSSVSEGTVVAMVSGDKSAAWASQRYVVSKILDKFYQILFINWHTEQAKSRHGDRNLRKTETATHRPKSQNNNAFKRNGLKIKHLKFKKKKLQSISNSSSSATRPSPSISL